MQIVACGTADRDRIAGGLSKLLADTQALYAETRRLHRGVGGSESIVLRPVLEQQCDELRLATELIAERMRSLGMAVLRPRGGIRAPLLKPAPVLMVQERIRCLVGRHEAVATRAQRLLGLAEKAHDSALCDLLMQRIQVHEKTGWVLAGIGIAELILEL
jgi:starvation-inducible DNA-binding protein